MDTPGYLAIHAELVFGDLRGSELVQRCLDRITAIDRELGAVLAVDPTAPDRAARSEQRYRDDADLGPLDGIPVLVKDNINTAGLASTAGSRLLAGSPPVRDAAVVTRLRDAGAVLLGKTNLSEWSNFRSVHATEGWSAVGGQTHNPFRHGHSPWGSSAGSAAAVAAGLAPLALGTETDGSVVGPAGVCGVIGIKPETGLLPLDGIAGISSAVDTVGVFGTSVRDAATALAVLSGRPDLAGVGLPLGVGRFGLWRPAGVPVEVAAVLSGVADALTRKGAVVVDLAFELPDEVVADGMFALYAEFRPTIERYLGERLGDGTGLAELIAGNQGDPAELALFGQDLFELAIGIPGGPAARAARTRATEEARSVLAAALRDNDISAILAPTNEPAWPIDYTRGDAGRLSTSSASALAGYPNVSVPAGLVDGLPVGVSVFGPRTLARLLPSALLVESACGPRPEPG